MTTLSIQSENRALNFINKPNDLNNTSRIGHGNERLAELSEKQTNQLLISSAHIKTEKEELECWICKAVFNSSHEFTHHIGSHNNTANKTPPSIKTRFSCTICNKMLGSANSLDRHILVHTGERPFKCKYCSLTFTTNGNMHRHIRVNHLPKNMNSLTEDSWSHDSNGSGDSYEDNDNESVTRNVKKRKFSDSEYNNNNNNSSMTIDNNNFDQKYKDNTSKRLDLICPVCHTNELSIENLEIHLAGMHPEYQARCEKCDLLFHNHHFLNLHVFMVHQRNEDMNGKKLSIPDIAEFIKESQQFMMKNASNELKLSQNLKCDKCFSQFSTNQELVNHYHNCTLSDVDTLSNENYSATDLSSVKSKRNHSESSVEEEKKRDEFFSGLDLKTNSHTCNKNMTNNIENKDLADIQSIITNTSTTHLITDLSKSPEPNSADVSPTDSGCGEEEQQDCFAAEFRKMKLRGEFPCRLCTSIFPNLRALKGHNRVHLNSCPGSINSPYRCNMCPHSSTDKSALLRHMRTHNGDRPYECSICRYAFTTKANCERHLRNRHSKMTRDEVRRAIIYHPSEDPTYEVFPENSQFSTKEEIKKALFNDSLKESINHLKSRARINSLINDKNKVPQIKTDSIKSNSSILNCSMNSSDWLDCSPERNPLNVSTPMSDDEEDEDDHDDEEEEGDNNISEEIEQTTNEIPLDLSVDALDLSKKNQASTPIKKEEEEPQDLSKRAPEIIESSDLQSPTYFAKNNLINYEDIKKESSPDSKPVDISELCGKNQLNQLYDLVENRPFPPNMNTQYHPYFFPASVLPLGITQHMNSSKDPFQKEILRGLQFNSRGVLDQIAIASAAERIHALQALAEYNKRCATKDPIKKPIVPISAQNVNYNNNENLSIKSQSNSSSVKMVLKDGVLQAKPKQRRYRTERPFFCEHCSGRFTLRSNMERHIKQQHPQFWIQKQRGGSSGSRRGQPYKLVGFSDRGENNKAIPILPGFIPSDNPVNCFEDPNHFNKNLSNLVNSDGLKSISDEVRIAISLQLKNKVITCEDTAKYYADFKSSDSSPDHLNSTDDRMDEHKGQSLYNSEIHCQSHERSEDNEEYDDDDDEEEELVIDEASVDNNDNPSIVNDDIDEERTDPEVENVQVEKQKDENGALDLASVSRILDNASTQTFRQFFHDEEERNHEFASEEDEEGLVAGSEGNGSGSEENRSESEQNINSGSAQPKKKSAYSLAPNRVFCPYCDRKFPWSSSLRRHILTHTGQKPYKCSHCPLLFTTKSNCDRHLLRKHGGQAPPPVELNVNDKNLESFTMRNVPERPYKCIYCPSSTFASLNNLNKHLSSKHSEFHDKKSDDANSGYEESQGSGSEDIEVSDKKYPVLDYHTSTDLPFKCYLCDGSYAERQEALDHIKSAHFSEFQLLISKGALDMTATAVQEEPSQNEDANISEETVEQLKGKFPDYANRKVMCAFCLRRFWSAEDLRRHMRTHTGERPFSCDICRRKFTLKHSMLRHRKKHNKKLNPEENFNSDDDTPVRNNFIDNNNSIINIPVRFWAKREQESSDLISNLLGIHDKTIIDKMLLTKSAEDAARLLGVQK